MIEIQSIINYKINSIYDLKPNIIYVDSLYLPYITEYINAYLSMLRPIDKSNITAKTYIEAIQFGKLPPLTSVLMIQKLTSIIPPWFKPSTSIFEPIIESPRFSIECRYDNRHLVNEYSTIIAKTLINYPLQTVIPISKYMNSLSDLGIIYTSDTRPIELDHNVIDNKRYVASSNLLYIKVENYYRNASYHKLCNCIIDGNEIGIWEIT